MKTTLQVIPLLVSLLAFNALGETSSTKTGQCQVRVVDARGQALSGVVVECYRGRDWRSAAGLDLRLDSRGTSDADGAVSFAGPKQAMLVFLARKPGLSVGWAISYSPWLGLDSEDSALELVLTPPAMVSGVVRDSAGKPIPDAAVWVSHALLAGSRGGRSWAPLPASLGRQYLATRTGPDGKFQIGDLPADATLDLAAAKPGLSLDRASATFFIDGSSSFRAGQSGIILTMTRAGAVEGQVVQEDTGAPLAGARVFWGTDTWSFEPESVSTGADGRFRLLDLYPDEHTLRAVVGTNEFSDWVCEPVTVTVEAGATNRQVKLVGSRGTVLQVTLSDQATGQTVKGATVWLTRETGNQAATTSDNGTALIRALPGEYQLMVNTEAYRTFQSRVSLELGQTNHEALTLEPAHRVDGTVMGPDGNPAPKVTVTTFPFPRGGKQTDAKGHFSIIADLRQFGGMQQSSQILIARDLARNLAVAQDIEQDATNANLKLQPALTLAGRVTDPKGNAITNAQVQVMFHAKQMSSSMGALVQADAQGRFEVKALPAGRTYSVNVSARGFGRETRRVETEQSGSTRVELDAFALPPADRRVAGVVVDADEKPVAGASVSGYGEQQPTLSGRTDAKGRFSFDHVCAGQINLSANKARGGGSGNTTAAAGDTNIVIQLGVSQFAGGSGKLSRLSGLVTDSEGKPAPKVKVILFPHSGTERQSDAEGRFKLSFNPDQVGSQQSLVLVARDLVRNQATALDVEPDATNATLKLEPALTLAGRITDTKGNALTNAEARLTFWTEHMGSSLGQPVRADAQGRFEIKGLPPGRHYGISVTAKNFGQDTRTLEATETATRKLELEPFQLAFADQRIAGVVLDSDDKPVAAASINISGDKQPNLHTNANSKGRFAFEHVSVGQIRLSANSPRGGYGSVVAEAGDTNIVLQFGISQSPGSSREIVRVSGTVTDPEGKPAPRVAVRLYPYFNGPDKQTDSEGRFKLVFNPNQWGGSQENTRTVTARDMARNLAVALEIEQDATNADLKLEPAVTAVGRVVSVAGQPITNAEVQVLLRTERMSSGLGGSIRADAQGRFEVKGLPPGARYNLMVSAKGFGVDNRDFEAKDAEGRRVELEPFQLAVADQRIAGVVLDADDKPVSGAYVNVYGDKQPNSNMQTDSKGRFAFKQLSAGPIRLSASSPRGGGFGSAEAEAGDTNITVQLGVSGSSGGSEKISRLSGTVTDLEGKPAPRVRVNLFPFNNAEKLTDAEGHYKLTFNPSEWGGSQDNQRVLVARDISRNLATALEVEQDATNADLKLEKGFTLAGRVTDPEGKPIARAAAQVMFHSGQMGTSLGASVPANSEGHFEIKALPPGCRYGVSVSAKGFGRGTANVEAADADKPRLELEPIQLVVADQRLAGVVLDSDDKPVAGAWLNVYGEKQPSLNGRSDSKGRFSFAQVCAGPIRLSVNDQHGGNAFYEAEGGDTNITIHLKSSYAARVSPPRRISLRGKPLPDLATSGLATTDYPADRPILLLLIDAEERPSRHAAKLLGEQAETLKQKGVTVVALQSGTMTAVAFAMWKQEAALAYPVGRFTEDPEKARAAWAAKTLPWLILADKAHRVTDEGFSLDDLEKKLDALAK